MATLAVQPEANHRKKRMCGLDRALTDVEEGRVYHADSVEDMFEALNKED